MGICLASLKGSAVAFVRIVLVEKMYFISFFFKRSLKASARCVPSGLKGGSLFIIEDESIVLFSAWRTI
jgi:hypothetical protein